MQLTSFFIESANAELPAIQFDDGTWYFSAQETCVFAGLASRGNASKWVRTHIPSKWTQEVKVIEGSGRPGLYLTKPGFLFAVCQGNTESAIKLRDEVFEVILPKIDASGGYIMPSATSDQVVALVQENQHKDVVIEDLMRRRGSALYDLVILQDRFNNLVGKYNLTLEAFAKHLGIPKDRPRYMHKIPGVIQTTAEDLAVLYKEPK